MHNLLLRSNAISTFQALAYPSVSKLLVTKFTTPTTESKRGTNPLHKKNLSTMADVKEKKKASKKSTTKKKASVKTKAKKTKSQKSKKK